MLNVTLFVLFLIDIGRGLHVGTNITMYADDTKIWRQMINCGDHLTVQADINYLLDWAFHPSKRVKM